MARFHRTNETAAIAAPRGGFLRGCFVAALLCHCVAASAQTIYKQVDHAGRTLFTDTPVATAVVFHSSLGGQLPAPADSDSSRAAMALPRLAANARSIDYNEAARRLRQAQRRLEVEVEPQLGERMVVAGVSMPNERYRERREGLLREVVAAQARFNEVSSPAGAAGTSKVAEARVPNQSPRRDRPMLIAAAGQPGI